MLSLVGELNKVPPERKMLTKIKMTILPENASRDIESPDTYGHLLPQSSWSQSHQVDNSTYHSRYSSRPGGSEMPPSSVQSPASNVSNFSEKSSILNINTKKYHVFALMGSFS